MSIRQRQSQKILKSAIVEFAHGYTTISDIAKRAGVPKANVHYYFKDKQDLYNQALDIALNDPDNLLHALFLARHNLDAGDYYKASQHINLLVKLEGADAPISL